MFCKLPAIQTVPIYHLARSIESYLIKEFENIVLHDVWISIVKYSTSFALCISWLTEIGILDPNDCWSTSGNDWGDLIHANVNTEQFSGNKTYFKEYV